MAEPVKKHWRDLASLVRQALTEGRPVQLSGRDHLLIEGLQAVEINARLTACEKELARAAEEKKHGR